MFLLFWFLLGINNFSYRDVIYEYNEENIYVAYYAKTDFEFYINISIIMDNNIYMRFSHPLNDCTVFVFSNNTQRIILTNLKPLPEKKYCNNLLIEFIN